MERYAEIVAALKIRTTNKKGRDLSTARAIRLLEEDGVETPDFCFFFQKRIVCLS